MQSLQIKRTNPKIHKLNEMKLLNKYTQSYLLENELDHVRARFFKFPAKTWSLR